MRQSCVASKRFTPGDPADPATTLAPLSSERAAQALIHQVEDAAAKGATVIIGGGRPDLPGAFVEPTILTGVSPAMRAYHEELFGPVAVVHRVAGEDEAVALANDTPFGLGGSVFAADIGRAQRVAARLDAGIVWINRPAASRPELPFGAIKRSGYGRELGAAGIDEFANRKLIGAVAPDAPVGGFAG
jgi:succinate-semialdehyde dehydrogenase/glutarate-semialdehyde dehydrogenase